MKVRWGHFGRRTAYGITLSALKRRDYGRAIQFAIDGMHFDRYVNSPRLLRLYGRYFLYSELNEATQVIAAYEDDRLLLADMQGEAKAYRPLATLVCRAGRLGATAFFKESVETYDLANQAMFSQYCKTHRPDGQIVFLAADPISRQRGIGTRLLSALEAREKGKTI